MKGRGGVQSSTGLQTGCIARSPVLRWNKKIWGGNMYTILSILLSVALPEKIKELITHYHGCTFFLWERHTASKRVVVGNNESWGVLKILVHRPIIQCKTRILVLQIVVLLI